MDKNKKIAVFGATGNLGDHFVRQTLDKGYDLCVQVRNESKFKHRENPKVKVMVGDATKPEDVAKVVKGVDVVVSCLGNVKKDEEYILIMEKSHSNILDVAAEQENIPRCVFISSVGCGGTSWLIKTMLTMIGGKPSFDDYEAADKRIREESKVPHLILRPYALTDKPGTGEYKIIEKQSATFAKPISRADVTKFLVNALEDRTWDNTTGIQLGGKKNK